MPQGDLEGLSIETDHRTLQLDTRELERLLLRTAEGERVRIQSVTIILTDHDTVRDLNIRYLDRDYLTDVIAFRYSEPGEGLEGEIYVDLDTASERHAEFNVPFAEEASRYAVHGMLHLCGYEDEAEEGRAKMRELEDRYLSSGVA